MSTGIDGFKKKLHNFIHNSLLAMKMQPPCPEVVCLCILVVMGGTTLRPSAAFVPCTSGFLGAAG